MRSYSNRHFNSGERSPTKSTLLPLTWLKRSLMPLISTHCSVVWPCSPGRRVSTDRFIAFRLLPTRWKGETIVVMDDVTISPPYTQEACVGGKEEPLARVKKVVQSCASYSQWFGKITWSVPLCPCTAGRYTQTVEVVRMRYANSRFAVRQCLSHRRGSVLV